MTTMLPLAGERKFIRRRELGWAMGLLAVLFGAVPGWAQETPAKASDARPNILFCIADDWGWPHASAYGDPVVKTPAFDRIAANGMLMTQAYISSPSCTPSRNAILTGQYHWRLGWGANLHSMLDTQHQTYPQLLAQAGYETGHWRKSWGPGRVNNWIDEGKGHPAGPKVASFDAFLDSWDRSKPFCFWLGASDPHRPYKPNSGVASGMDLDQIKLFGHFPDSPTVRSDVADYYFEVQRFDSDVDRALKKLESLGLLENTLVVMTGDHGMPFPRCKSNLYDSGARVPMAVQWPARIQPGRRVTDFVSTTDLAPTFLEAAGVAVPDAMTGRSWGPLFDSDKSGRVDPQRDHVLTGKERHVPCQEGEDTGGTPMRALRNDRYLLIHNYRPDRWPAGTPNYLQAMIPSCWLGDCDNGPTKTYMVDHQNDDDYHRQKYALSFGKRPEWELYDLRSDPDQLNNVADDPAYAETRQQLAAQLRQELLDTGDPRETGSGIDQFETTPYFGSGPRHPSFRPPRKNNNKNNQRQAPASSGKQ